MWKNEVDTSPPADQKDSVSPAFGSIAQKLLALWIPAADACYPGFCFVRILHGVKSAQASRTPFRQPLALGPLSVLENRAVHPCSMNGENLLVSQQRVHPGHHLASGAGAPSGRFDGPRHPVFTPICPRSLPAEKPYTLSELDPMMTSALAEVSRSRRSK